MTDQAVQVTATFQGMGGAAALTAIAFSIVFLVLGGLTAMIYAMRVITVKKKTDPQLEQASTQNAQKAQAQAKKQPETQSQAQAQAQASDDQELVAVIAAAIAAHSAGQARVSSLTPAAPSTGGWALSGWLGNLERSVLDPWG